MGSCLAKQAKSDCIKPENQKASANIPASAKAQQPVIPNQNRLFGFRLCPFTARVRLAIQAKGVKFEQAWEPGTENWFNFDWVGAARTSQKVLALQHGERMVKGSPDAIIEYIDETFREPPLIPSGDVEGPVREWTSYVRDKFSPLVSQLLCDGSEASQQELVPRLDAVFGRLDHAMWLNGEGGPFFFGSQFTMTDVYLIPFLDLVQLLTYFRGIEISSSYSRLLSYSKKMESFSVHIPVKLDIAVLKLSIAKTLLDGAPPPVLIVITLQHKSILAHLDRVVQLADELAGRKQGLVATNQQQGLSQMRLLSKKYGQLVEIMQEHAQMEERFVFPALENVESGVTQMADNEHARQLPIMNGIREDIKSIAALEMRSPVRDEALHALAIRLRKFWEQTTDHFEEEESKLLPVLQQAGLGVKHQEVLVTKSLCVMESSHSHLLPNLLSTLSPDEIYQYMNVAKKCLGDSKPVLLRRMIQMLKAADEELQSVWKVIQERLPALATRWDCAAGS